jgi:hypothetical protein
MSEIGKKRIIKYNELTKIDIILFPISLKQTPNSFIFCRYLLLLSLLL